MGNYTTLKTERGKSIMKKKMRRIWRQGEITPSGMVIDLKKTQERCRSCDGEMALVTLGGRVQARYHQCQKCGRLRN